jgi:hypothetical protein
LLLTASQAAGRLGVPIEKVLGWAVTGQLQIAGQDEDGRALFREGVIDSVGEDLAALIPLELRCAKKGQHRPRAEEARSHACGCNLGRSSLHLCPTGAALNAALQLADMLAAAMPHDPLLRRLVALCREALSKHLTPSSNTAALFAVVTSDKPIEMTTR